MVYYVSYEVFTCNCFTNRQEQRFTNATEQAKFIEEIKKYANIFNIHTYAQNAKMRTITNYQ